MVQMLNAAIGPVFRKLWPSIPRRMATIAVFGTLDTKGDVHRFLAERVRSLGHRALLLDVGLLGQPQVEPAMTRRELLERTSLDEAALDTGREEAAVLMGRSAGIMLARLFLEGGVDAVISVGGRCGAAIALAAMRALPLGVPSALVTHLAAEWVDVEAGLKDVLLVRSPIEIEGLNRIVRPILARAAGMLCGAVEFGVRAGLAGDPPLVVCSRFGPSDLGFERASRLLQEAGYEVVDFTEKGHGGKLMDSVIAGGAVAGVLDLSLTDLADEVVGGVLGCGSRRMEAAAKRAVPTLVAPGGVDTVHFEMNAVPQEFWGRTMLESDGMVLMRTSPEECRRIGSALAEKLNRFVGPVTVCLPLRGLSALGSPGQPFHDPAADFAFFDALQNNLRDGVRVLKVHTTSEEAPFAELSVQTLLENIGRRESEQRLLRQIIFFREASDLLLSEAIRLAEMRAFAAGEFLFKQGAAVDAVWIVSSGALELLEGGRRVGKLGMGAVWGEAQFLKREVAPFGLRAMESCEMLQLRRSTLDQLRRRHPALEVAMTAASAGMGAVHQSAPP
jgi:uncharacterized protein (UPF0261 family)